MVIKIQDRRAELIPRSTIHGVVEELQKCVKYSKNRETRTYHFLIGKLTPLKEYPQHPFPGYCGYLNSVLSVFSGQLIKLVGYYWFDIKITLLSKCLLLDTLMDVDCQGIQ